MKRTGNHVLQQSRSRHGRQQGTHSFNVLSKNVLTSQGIGLAIVRQLALQYPKSPLNNGPFLIYLTARDQGREAAVKDLEQDAQLKQAKALKADGGLAEIKFHLLDITSSDSIKALAGHLKQDHSDGIDFVINNAGIAMDGFGTLSVFSCSMVLMGAAQTQTW